jgi:hypothetical protein
MPQNMARNMPQYLNFQLAYGWLMATTTGTTVGINKWFTGPSMWLIYGILMKNGPGIVSLWKPKIQWILWIVYHSIKAPHHEYQYDLVGGFNPSEKYSLGIISPNIWKNKNVPHQQPLFVWLYHISVSIRIPISIKIFKNCNLGINPSFSWMLETQ